VSPGSEGPRQVPDLPHPKKHVSLAWSTTGRTLDDIHHYQVSPKLKLPKVHAQGGRDGGAHDGPRRVAGVVAHRGRGTVPARIAWRARPTTRTATKAPVSDTAHCPPPAGGRDRRRARRREGARCSKGMTRPSDALDGAGTGGRHREREERSPFGQTERIRGKGCLAPAITRPGRAPVWLHAQLDFSPGTFNRE
jgi:hypothetical protein